MPYITPPQGALEIQQTLANAKFDAYFVGGCVRDSLLGKAPKDWDICTSAVPHEVREVLRNYVTIPTGEQYGTLTVHASDGFYEVTTFRGDGNYSDGRRPDNVTFSRNLADDLARRDFTMNAVAYSPERGIIDLFNGVADIKSKIIRAVGDPTARFSEDALRIFRCVRFASEIGFEVEAQTNQAAIELAPLLKNVSAERISVELMRTLSGDNSENILLEFLPVFAQIIPELAKLKATPQHNPYHFANAYSHTAKVVASAPKTPELRMAALLHDIGKIKTRVIDANSVDHFYAHPKVSVEIAEEILRNRLSFSNDFIDDVLVLIKYHDAEISQNHASIRRWLNKIGERRFRLLLTLNLADAAGHSAFACEKRIMKIARVQSLLDEVLATEQCFSLKQLAINGNDLLTLGYEKGPQIGIALKFLLGKVISGECENVREKLLALLET